MRRIWIMLALVGCRQALGIPGGGEVAGEDGFHVEAVVRGGDGATNGAAVMLNDQIEDLADGTITLATALPDGVAFTITPIADRGDCRVVNGTGTIDGANAAGVEITCDGLAAVLDPGFTAPADFGTGFDPTLRAIDVFGSTLTQQTYLRPAAINDGTTITVGGQPVPDPVLGFGPFGFVDAVVIETANAGFARDYTLRPVLQPPAPFGYGKPSVVEPGGGFGAVVAMAGDLLVAGAPDRGTGRAFVFRRSGRDWVEEQELVPVGAQPGDRFGASVAILGDTIAVGAPADASRPGAVHLFAKTGATWTDTVLPGVANGDEFGAAVALAATHVVVGAPNAKFAGESPAAGCVFQLLRSNPATVVKASSQSAGDRFGASLAVSGTRLVVGAPGEASAIPGDRTDRSYPGAGAVFVLTVGAAALDAYVKPTAPLPAAEDAFGTAVAIDGDVIVVGAPLEDSAARGVDDVADPNVAIGSGAAYVFAFAGGAWSQRHYLKSAASVAGDNFGRAVAVLGNSVGSAPRTTVVVVGAPYQDSKRPDTPDDGAALDSGAAFTYALSPTLEVVRSDYVKAVNIGAGDAFGTSLTLGVDSLVVGAPAEDSSRSGWNNVGNEAAGGAGAVYAIR